MYDTLDLVYDSDRRWISEHGKTAKERFYLDFMLRAVKGQLTEEDQQQVNWVREMEKNGIIKPLVLRGVRILVTGD